jgi:imidazoleglycerol phosphate dehydratase HisB
MLGTWDTQLIPEFFGGFVENAKCCLHLHQICGRNAHHIVEAAFKATARAIRQAIKITGEDIPSTKGTLA